MNILRIAVKEINKEQNHYIVTVPFCTGHVKFEYFDDLFGFDNYNNFIKMIRNYLKPDKIEVTKC